MKKINMQAISSKDSLLNRKFLILYMLIFFLLFLFITASIWLYTTYRATKSYESYVLQIANLNKETIFSLDTIFIFSSATATNHADSKALWSLDIHQFSDISLFIHNHASGNYTTKNTISKLYLDNFNIEGTRSWNS